jgi:hypothetical protein
VTLVLVRSRVLAKLPAGFAGPEFAVHCDQHTYEATKALYGMTNVLASAF